MDEKVIQTEHLTEQQLTAYSAGMFESKESRIAAGRHLLQCAECLAALPAPTPERFLSVLFGEDEFDENPKPKRQKFASSVYTRFSQPFSAFLSPRTLAWSGGAVLILSSVLGFTLITSSNQVETSRETTVARSNATAAASAVSTTPQQDKSNSAVQSDAGSKQPAEPDDGKTSRKFVTAVPTKKRQSIGLTAAVKNAKKTEAESKPEEPKELARLSDNELKAVASLTSIEETILRSNNRTANLSATFSLLAPVGEISLSPQPMFRWEKVPGAKSYRISVFDAEFNEVLSAETVDNSFCPNKQLERGAKYLWRVAAQTETGEVVSPRPPQPPAVFQIANQKDESRIKKLQKSGDASYKLAAHFAKAGLFDLAADTLRQVLAKHSGHRAARRLLAQVEQRRTEIRAAIQRCKSAPTTTKPAQ